MSCAETKNAAGRDESPRRRTLRFMFRGDSPQEQEQEGGRTGQWEKVKCDEVSTADSGDPAGIS